MAEVLVQISGVLYDKLSRTERPVLLQGAGSLIGVAWAAARCPVALNVRSIPDTAIRSVRSIQAGATRRSRSIPAMAFRAGRVRRLMHIRNIL